MKRKTGIISVVLLIIAGCAEKSPPEMTICCAGDSLMRPLPPHIRRMTRTVSRDVLIKNWSQGGLSTRTYMSFFKKRVKSRRQLEADFILLQLGTNDVKPLYSGKYALDAFQKNMKTIIWEFKSYFNGEKEPSVVIVATVPPIYLAGNEKLNAFIRDRLNPSIKRLAEEEKVFLADHWGILRGKRRLYGSDGVHLNRRGENVLAQNWMAAMRRAVIALESRH